MPQLSQTALAKETSWHFTETGLTGSELGVEFLCPVTFFADDQQFGPWVPAGYKYEEAGWKREFAYRRATPKPGNRRT